MTEYEALVVQDRQHNNVAQLRPFVGARIVYKSNVGTVRYIGNLDGYSDDDKWIGVEWDEASRGKHSGSHKGKHYFTTKVHNAASFVKAIKLGNGARITLVEAARQRLADAKDQSHRMAAIVVGRGVVDIADEGSAVNQLAGTEVLDISNMGVATIRSDGDKPLAQILPQLKDLRAAHSLFTNVSAIIEILCTLPKLEILDVSYNRFTEEDVKSCEYSDEEVAKIANYEASKVTELILNKCMLEWKAVAKVCKHIEALENLRMHTCGLMPLNSMWKMGEFEMRWASLQVLDLDGNRMSWEDVHKLSRLPSLKELYISDNGLEDILVDDGGNVEQMFGTQCTLQDKSRDRVQGTVPFPKLHTLSVARNQLRGWTVITSLNALPALSHLRMIGNPISPPGADEKTGKGPQRGWHLRAIARIRRLTRIDGSDVTLDERLQAERRYMQEEILPAIQTTGQVMIKKFHPRSEELMQKLNLPITNLEKREPKMFKDSNNKGTLNEGLAADSVHVTLVADTRINAKRKRADRVLPRDTRVERLMAMACIILRMQDHYAKGKSHGDDSTKLGLTVRVGEGGVPMKLGEGRSLASCVNSGDERRVTITIQLE